jgi:hypothetical protein
VAAASPPPPAADAPAASPESSRRNSSAAGSPANPEGRSQNAEGESEAADAGAATAARRTADEVAGDQPLGTLGVVFAITAVVCILVVCATALACDCSVWRAAALVAGALAWGLEIVAAIALVLLILGGGPGGPRTGNLRTCRRCGTVSDRSVAFGGCPNCGSMLW